MKSMDFLELGLYPVTHASEEEFEFLKQMAPMRFSMFESVAAIKEAITEQDIPMEDVYLTAGLYDITLFDGKWAFMEYHNFPGMKTAKSWNRLKTDVKKWEAAEKYSTILTFVPKAYRKTIVQRNLDEIPQDARRELLLDIRTHSEYQFEEFDEEVFIPEMSKSKENAADLAELKKLHPEDVLTIYRGATPESTDIEESLSWTTDLKFAEYFATRFNSEGVVYKATVNFEDVLAFADRESEVLVQYENLSDVDVLKQCQPTRRKQAE